MKKILFLVLVLCMILACAVACMTGCTQKDDGPSVVCTVFPVYDWTKNVMEGSDLTLGLLLDSGADLHNFNPTVQDMMTIAQCDLFIYVGGESDEKWVDRTLAAYPNENRRTINLLEALGDRAFLEEAVEGMQEEDCDPDEEEEEEEYDEHIWLSLKNASFLTDIIEKELEKVDPAHAETYKKTAEAYKNKLNALDTQYAEAVKEAPIKTLLFADRFPFLYMTKDYNLTYYAAFKGCSTDVNATPETIQFLTGKLNELGLKYVMTIDGSDKKVAETVIRNSNAKNQTVLSINSLQTAGRAEVDAGLTYYDTMKDNLAVLKQALQ